MLIGKRMFYCDHY